MLPIFHISLIISSTKSEFVIILFAAKEASLNSPALTQAKQTSFQHFGLLAFLADAKAD